jgi:ubiquinone/menaquinone biosynthesis C-methylase UbiE
MTSLDEQMRSIGPRFDRVASTYDLLTGLNPGYHRHLRLSASRLGAPARPRILDLCCGTGASTEAILATYPDAEVVALDASRGMLAEARRKLSLRGVELVQGDATDPEAAGIEGPFDGVLMAYGIRNLLQRDEALVRVLSLLAPGSRACFHEYSVADSCRSRIVWDAVCLGLIVPGGLLTVPGSDIYRYLHTSVRAFDGVRAFEARLQRAGFAGVWTGGMDGWQQGIVHSFVGRRP